MNRLTTVLAALFVLSAPSLLAQAALGTFQYTTSYSQTAQNGYVAVLDLSSGTLAPVVTALATNCSSPKTVYTTTTAAFAANTQAFVAITANTGKALTGSAQQCGAPDGLIVSNGQWVNWPQTSGLVLYFTSNSSATITNGQLPLLPAIQNAVAGSTLQDSDCPTCQAGSLTLQELGTLLVQGGNPGACPIPKSAVMAARGAIGLDPTNRYLIILIAAGAEPSSGLYTYDFALLMMAFGGYSAVNFDGGGSTVFNWLPDFGSPKTCPACAQFITGATVGATNPNNLTITNLATPALSTTIQYSAQTPNPRAVYASIGFLPPLAAKAKGKPKKP